ncbi:Phosphatidylinositol-glycan biosynthesis class F protein [Psilocybe cubensis]|uniref:Uncharacterized protein n=2 Tax=Psilocybe cubensis TaxID=181762 RepID=A0A8H8CHG7_PSICU|nr:Phosphatidylinositol-glycan biosynthesis class F protein [Psilocybe cubensis]KAH9474549.1 Phosphatidylinositol-glycan biosynthesis class F protein [Psilocybe cubensis]
MTNSKRKVNAKKTPPSVTKNVPNSKDLGVYAPLAMPMTSYISKVGVHTTLWMFVALYLPRTKFFLGELVDLEWGEQNQVSLDQPQHPFLDALTVNPASTLIYICLGAAILQMMWAGTMRDWWLKLGVRGSEDERRTEIALLNRQKFTITRNACAATIAASFFIHFILILFGAPITSLVLKTYLLSLLISIITVYPPAYTIGISITGNNSASIVNRWTWVRLFTEFQVRNPVERNFVYSEVGTVVGCWLGIIPLALDWIRPWQAWPLTPAFGAIAGYIIATLSALTVSIVVQLAEDHRRAQDSLEKSE